jgi:hypothetical protein
MGRDVEQLAYPKVHTGQLPLFFSVPAHEDNHLPALLTSYFRVALGARVRMRVKTWSLRGFETWDCTNGRRRVVGAMFPGRRSCAGLKGSLDQIYLDCTLGLLLLYV